MPNMFRIKNGLFRSKDRSFELVHRSGWKQFLHRYAPKRLQNMLLKRHLRNTCSFPVSMSIEITNICNARCWFCPQPLSKRQKGYMDFPLYSKIMDEIKANGAKVKTIALFMDGEPTLHR